MMMLVMVLWFIWNDTASVVVYNDVDLARDHDDVSNGMVVHLKCYN